MKGNAIHKPGILIPGKMAYAGALEPTDETQLGPHGYIRGTVDEHGARIHKADIHRSRCDYFTN